jgi:hypothetical protein
MRVSLCTSARSGSAVIASHNAVFDSIHYTKVKQCDTRASQAMQTCGQHMSVGRRTRTSSDSAVVVSNSTVSDNIGLKLALRSTVSADVTTQRSTHLLSRYRWSRYGSHKLHHCILISCKLKHKAQHRIRANAHCQLHACLNAQCTASSSVAARMLPKHTWVLEVSTMHAQLLRHTAHILHTIRTKTHTHKVRHTASL